MEIKNWIFISIFFKTVFLRNWAKSKWGDVHTDLSNTNRSVRLYIKNVSDPIIQDYGQRCLRKSHHNFPPNTRTARLSRDPSSSETFPADPFCFAQQNYFHHRKIKMERMPQNSFRKFKWFPNICNLVAQSNSTRKYPRW